MINAGSPVFMAVSNDVNSTYEKSYLAVLFYNYVYLEKIGGLNFYFKNKETEKWQRHGKSKCSNKKHAL